MLFMPQRKRRTYSFIFWLFGILIGQLFFSCANEDCVSIFNNHLLVGFINADTLETGEIVFDDVDTIFYSIKAEGNDSGIYEPCGGRQLGCQKGDVFPRPGWQP